MIYCFSNLYEYSKDKKCTSGIYMEIDRGMLITKSVYLPVTSEIGTRLIDTIQAGNVIS